jgi:hypothetical protein
MFEIDLVFATTLNLSNKQGQDILFENKAFRLEVAFQKRAQKFTSRHS